MTRNIISVAALIALLVGSLIAINQQGVPLHTTDAGMLRATLEVRDAAGLMPRSRVLLRGIPIGEITTISPDARKVSVEFKYSAAIRLPLDSVYRVEDLSALGEAYLSIKPMHDGAPVLADNQRIIADAATAAGSIGDTAVAFTRIFDKLDPEQVNRIVDEVSTALSNESAVPVVAAASAGLKKFAVDRKNDIGSILTGTQRLLDHSDTIATSMNEFQHAAPDFFTNLQSLAEGALVLIYQTGDHPADLRKGALAVLQKVQQFLKDVGPNLYNLTEPLVPPMQATAAALMTIDTSRLLDSALDSVEAPGAFSVHVIPSK
ncbi:hypothetical protein BOO86_21750 [Mycobacterium sp. CBMA 234]|uniref:MlaD family protein n=1 Tax=Mycolicibacterium sp. CBMA 234 TaxID=1918495 RepID=UPI0012DCEFF6|nr:MlaD family protein [Mycolicibacterium sp. CBMA 234]MUL67113.1 hypothetical protein [Mycolicibacterium sp. CBMA 234]